MDAIKDYRRLKSSHQNTLLVFCEYRSSFHEMFGADAEVAAETLGLPITTREKAGGSTLPMAGFPAAAWQINRKLLLLAGHQVALCEPVLNVWTRKLVYAVCELATPRKG